MPLNASSTNPDAASALSLTTPPDANASFQFNAASIGLPNAGNAPSIKPSTDINAFLAGFGMTSTESGGEDAALPLISDELLLPPTPPGPGSSTIPDTPPVLPPGVAAPPLPGGQLEPAPGPVNQLPPGPAEQPPPAPTEPLAQTNPVAPEPGPPPNTSSNPVSQGTGAGGGGSGSSGFGGFSFGAGGGGKAGVPAGGLSIGGLPAGGPGLGGVVTGLVAGGSAYVATHSLFDDGDSYMDVDSQPEHPPLIPTLTHAQIQAMRDAVLDAMTHWGSTSTTLENLLWDLRDQNTRAISLQNTLNAEIQARTQDLTGSTTRIAEDTTAILNAQEKIRDLEEDRNEARRNIADWVDDIRQSEAAIVTAAGALERAGNDSALRQELADTIVSKSNAITDARDGIATHTAISTNTQASIDEWNKLILQNEVDIRNEQAVMRTTESHLLQNQSSLDGLRKSVVDNLRRMRPLELEDAAAKKVYELTKQEWNRIQNLSDEALSHYVIPHDIYYGTVPHADRDQNIDDDDDSHMSVDDDVHPTPPPVTLPLHPSVHIGITPPPTVLNPGTGATHTTTTSGTPFVPSEAQSGSHRASGPMLLSLAPDTSASQEPNSAVGITHPAAQPGAGAVPLPDEGQAQNLQVLRASMEAWTRSASSATDRGAEDVDMPGAQELILIGTLPTASEDGAARPT